MTDLSSAEPGDTAIVAMILREKDHKTGRWCASFKSPATDNFYPWLDPDAVRAIEKAPKPLQRGDMVFSKRHNNGVGRIIAISMEHAKAFVDWGDMADSRKLDSLEKA